MVNEASIRTAAAAGSRRFMAGPAWLAPSRAVYQCVDMKSASTTIRIPTEMHEELRGFAEEQHSTLTGTASTAARPSS